MPPVRGSSNAPVPPPPVPERTIAAAPPLPAAATAAASSSSSSKPDAPATASKAKPYTKRPAAARKTMRAPSQRKGPPPAKYMFFPRHTSSPHIDLLRCNIWQRDAASQVRWGSIQTGYIKPPPDASVSDVCRRTDIVCASNPSSNTASTSTEPEEEEEKVVASVFWRNGYLSSVVVQSKEAIVHREEYKHVLEAPPIGFSWPDGHRFFTWTPVDGADDVSGIIRNGNTTATVHPSPGYVVLAPVFASYERVEILLIACILARYKRGMLDIEGSGDEEFEQGNLVWVDGD